MRHITCIQNFGGVSICRNVISLYSTSRIILPEFLAKFGIKSDSWPWGGKNYMFAGNHSSAQRIAMMYSFIGTCKANVINLSEWLEDTLNKINETSILDLEKLLPLKKEA